MLVLARKANQSIVVDENIRIVVLGINGDRVRIGIEAPPEIAIIREEIIDIPRRSGDSSHADITLELQLTDDPEERG